MKSNSQILSYYPFGMAMPGRNGYAISGGWANSTMKVNNQTFPADLSITTRSNNTPAEYTAVNSISFTGEFEDGGTDEYMAYIIDPNNMPASSSPADNSSDANSNVIGSSDEGYRYGFNGQEKGDEIYGEGNAMSFKYRVEDTRLGRFFSVDPIAKDFPWNSPYAFAENRVIDGKELKGKEVLLVGKQETASLIISVTTEYGILVNFSNGAIHGYVSTEGGLTSSFSATTGFSFTFFPTMTNSYDAANWGYYAGASIGPVVGTQQSGNIVYSSGKIGVNYTVGLGGGKNLLLLPFTPQAGASFTTLIPISEMAKKENGKEILTAAQSKLNETRNSNTQEINSLNIANEGINKQIGVLGKQKQTETTTNKIKLLQEQNNQNNQKISSLTSVAFRNIKFL